MILLKKTITIALLLLFYASLYSQTSDAVIKSITFEGLKRTKVSTIEKIIKPIEAGSVYTSNTTNEIAQKINAENIFAPFIKFDVIQTGSDVDITVHVKDRWTIIPAPLFSISSTSWFFGVYFTENNFLGYNKDLTLIGTYGNTGWRVGGVYKDNQFIDNFVNLNISLEGGLAEYQDIDIMQESIDVRMYQNYFISTEVEFLFNVRPRFKVGLGLQYNGFWDIKDTMIIGNSQHIDTVNTLGIISSIEYKIYNYEYPFDEGVAIRLNGGYLFGIGDSPSSYSISGEINSALILHELQRIGGGIFGGFGQMPAQLEFRVSGNMGAYIIPQTLIAADYYASLNIFYEVIFLDLSIANRKPFGRMGLQIFYESGLYNSDAIDFAYYHGPGIAILAYPNFISTPAIEFRVGYNVVNSGFIFRFGMFRYL